MLVSEAPIGTKIMFGCLYGDDEDIVWRKVSDSGDFIAETNCGYIQFDAREPESVSRARRESGNNFFPDSNILQWLNATGKGWFEKKHEQDREPNYHFLDGFLSCFTEQELGVIEDREITVAVPLGSRKAHGKTCRITCRVCLPSASEVGYHDEDLQVEGQELPEIARFLSENRYPRMMTRTGVRDAGHIMAYVTNSLEPVRAAHSGTVHPMIRLKGDTVISDAVDAGGVRYLTGMSDTFINKFFNVIDF